MNSLEAVPIPQFTLHQDVNEFLNQLHSKMRAVLQDHLVALYLGGSLALGEFNPQRSDIDFIAVTAGDLPPEKIVALEEMHRRLWAAGAKWARKLDGSYVPQQSLRVWNLDHTPCPFVEGESFSVTNQGSALIQRYIIRQHGVVVAGPAPHSWIDRVSADELRHGLGAMLEKYWRPLLDDPAWLQPSQEQPFAALTMCRALYTLQHGEIASKPVAARWVQQTTGEQWTTLIEWALAGPHDTGLNYLQSTLNLIQYALRRFSEHSGLSHR